MSRFGVRPFPTEHESLNGYLLRLGALNGFFSLRDALSAITPEKPKQRNWGRWKPEELHSCMMALAPLMGRPKNICEAPFKIHHSGNWIYSEARMIHDLRVDFPRICPHCLSEGDAIDWRWGLAVIGKCRKHRQALIDTCPKCDHSLEWKDGLLKGCTKCEYTWDKHAHVDAEPMSPLESRIWAITDDNSLDTDGIIDQVCAAIVVMARPYDSIHQAIHAVPRIRHYSELVSKAYRHLDQSDARWGWNQQCNVARSPLSIMGEQALCIPQRNLERLIDKELPFASKGGASVAQVMKLSQQQAEHPEFVKLARRKLIPSNDEGTEALRYQVDAAAFSECAKISTNDIQMLVDAGCLEALNTTSVLRDQLFDLRRLAEFIQEFSGFIQPRPIGITLNAKSLVLTSHFVRYGTLLGAVLNRQLCGWLDSSEDLHSITVYEEDLRCWLAPQLERACSGPLSINRVMKALQCGECTLYQHVRDGHFAWSRLYSGKERVDGPSLYRYLTTEVELYRSQEV